ncbi:MAG: SurA N-terminal domain-containing protein [Lentimicrobiaceae bacterium]|nr:SurA N-terminal domain-containing protein [Lentimicrobiaceae bacterium]
MAAIGSIRKHSALLLIVVAVALLAFILGDLSRKSHRTTVSEKFIVVGKEYLSHNQFLNVYNASKEEIRGRAERALTPEDDFEINRYVYNQLVDSMLFAMQLNSLGITVTADELHDLVAGPQPHQRAAQFFAPQGYYDMRAAQNFLENLDQIAQSDSAVVAYYLGMEADIEKEACQSKYLNLLSKAYYMPKAFARKVAEESSWKAELEIVQLPYSSSLVSDDKITVTDADLKKWYEENKYRFKQEEELRAVDYVIFPIQPSEADLKEIEENVAQMYEEFTQTDEPKLFVNRMRDTRFDSTYYKFNELPEKINNELFLAPIGTFVEPYIDGDMWVFAKLLAAETRPDSINVSFAFVSWYGMDQRNPRKKEESQAMADSAYYAIMSGVNFVEVSEKFSDLPPSQLPDTGKIWMVDGSDSKYFGDDQHVFDTLYNFNAGTIIKREVPAGIIIYRLNEKTAAERKIQVAIGKKIIEASTETIENIESAASNFANGTDDYKKFSDAVIKHNLDKRTFDRVEKMTYALPGTSGNGSREIIKWIYDENTKKEDVSAVQSLGGMYVVVVVKDIYEKGYKPLENERVKQEAEAMVKRDKKAEMLEKMLEKSVAEKKSIAKIAEKYEKEAETAVVSFSDWNFSRFGPESKVIGQIFAQKDAGTKIYKGDMGVYVVKINKFDIPTMDIEASNASSDMYVQQNTMMYQRRVFQNGAQALKKMYKIEDNRYKSF